MLQHSRSPVPTAEQHELGPAHLPADSRPGTLAAAGSTLYAAQHLAMSLGNMVEPGSLQTVPAQLTRGRALNQPQKRVPCARTGCYTCKEKTET